MDISTLKGEMQGTKGLVNKLRKEFLENTKEMARLAFEKLENERNVIITEQYILQNVDELLKDLIRAETEIYKEREPLVISKVLPYYYNNYYNKGDNSSYPETYKLMEKLIELKGNAGCLETDKFIESVTDYLTPAIDIISFSQKQSAKSRVGASLQNHLKKIFDIINIEYEEQVKIGKGGAKLDFIIPSVEKFNQEPGQAMNIECQTTLKDRFRLTLGKITAEHAKKYLVTATGCSLITDNDIKDLSIDKVNETIVVNNTTLVVFSEVKEQLIRNINNYVNDLERNNINNPVITIDEGKKLKRLSNNKIITFDDLIKRHIKLVSDYWRE
jgi:hypothetical protein